MHLIARFRAMINIDLISIGIRRFYLENIVTDDRNDYGGKNENFADNTSPRTLDKIIGKPKWMWKKIDNSQTFKVLQPQTGGLNCHGNNRQNSEPRFSGQ